MATNHQGVVWLQDTPRRVVLQYYLGIYPLVREGRQAFCMRAIGIVGEIDEHHTIRAEAPRDLPPGRVQLIVVRPDEDEAGAFWPWDLSQAWSDELGDVRQDLYTLADGQPVDVSR